MALLKSYNQADPHNNLKGIAPSREVKSAFYTQDPLADGEGSTITNINKPGRSIPSMFARMIYFRTAFESVKDIRIPANQPKPIYNRLVSLCLDLLYLVYSQDPNLRVEKWNRQGQLKKLSDQGNTILKEALEKQCNDYFLKTEKNATGVIQEVFRTDDIYLFFHNENLIGGTSPFTFTFTSPDWAGLGSARSLVEREPDFREYVYKLLCAYNNVPSMKEFMSYVGKCKNYHEQDPKLKKLDPGVIGVKELESSYAQYKKNEHEVSVCQIPDIRIWTRKPEDFTSDFFINSPLQGAIDVENTPLFLCTGNHQGLSYVGNKMWDSNTSFQSIAYDDNDTKPRLLPGHHLEHVYLSVNDFLENELLKLPYKIDSQKYMSMLDGDVSYLLPLRPMFFKFFGLDSLEKLFMYEIGNNRCKVTLMIPVTSADGQRKHELMVEKIYDLDNDTKSWAGRESVNLGIFPFYQIPQGDDHFPNLTNRYVVMHNINGDGDEFDTSELSFYRIGDKQPIEGVEGTETNGNTKAIYYHLDISGQDNGFDYIRMSWKKGGVDTQIISGIVIPNFEKPNRNGNQDYVYAIDFGTTNTHVAFKSSNANNPVSFTSDEIKLQVGYLNTINNRGTFSGNDEILENEKRHFFPHVNDDSYTFPFRTASKKQGAIDSTSRLFSNASIGFHYSRDFVRDGYEAELKWKLDNVVMPSVEIDKQCTLFFEELLWMVKNHWMTKSDANKRNKPKIVFTYPQAMTMHQRILALGQVAYETIFECSKTETKQNVREMVESLAPCFRLINQNALGNDAMLNIDIGGGTTDLQYYRAWPLNGGTQIDCYYTSVLFAGDDIWGKGYEHVEIAKGAENTNNFKDVAIEQRNNIKIQIDGISHPIETLQDLECKEFVAVLLRDENQWLTKWLRNHGNAHVCRKILFLHYSAIIYYVSLWLRDNGLKNPKKIQFTGLGSMYIDLLFSDNNKLQKFTKEIINKVTGDDIQGDFEITISDRPKHATAEGASLFSGNNAIENEMAFHTGIDGMNAKINGNKLADYEEKLMDSFKKFLNTYNNLPGDIEGVNIPKLSKSEVDAFITKASTSLQEMTRYYTNKFGGENATSVNDPMFFWPFKGPLSKIGL